jgi:hypothetical protein
VPCIGKQSIVTGARTLFREQAAGFVVVHYKGILFCIRLAG